MAKWAIEKHPDFEEAWYVHPVGYDARAYGTFVDYYKETGKAYCNSCSGPLSAQSQSCRHAKALVRFMRKNHGKD